jgi:hypothetical protein
LEAVNLVGFVAFFWLIQSQPHAGSTSSIAAEKNPQGLILADLSFKIGPGLIVDSNHDLNSIIKEYKTENRCAYNIHACLRKQVVLDVA